MTTVRDRAGGCVVRILLAALALMLAAGCFTIEGKDSNPVEHRTYYLTSGYTLNGCQQNLDQMAGAPVQMTAHAGSPMMWITLGLVPAYTCQGFVETAAATQSK